MIRKRIWSLFLVIIFLQACRKDIPPLPENPILTGSEDGVYITNEGNFQFGNAAVSYYEEGLANAVPDLFEPTNNRPLGDVCQSMCFFNGLAYIVVNNSNKIEVVNANNFASVTTITGFNSPRYFLPVSNSKAYVTDLYDDAISIVDLSSNQRTGEIACAGWTEELVLAYGKAFVTNRERNQLYIINTMNDQLTDSIEIGAGANSIIEDRNGKLWVLCSGSNSNNINATLHRINPIENTVEISFTFNFANDSPRRLDINGTNDTLYFLNEGVVQMPINANALPSTTLIPTDGRNFYGLGIHPQTKEILVADAIDYVQRGKIYVYQANGTLVKTYLAGIIPGDFYFKN